MSLEVEALEAAKRFLREEVAPKAQLIDQDVTELHKIVDRMGELNLLALKRPMRYGGPEMPEALFRIYQEEVARTSGTLAFLTTQHQSAVGMIAGGENEKLKDRYLPLMASGEKLVGIGFSQLRRSGPPIMCATPVEGGYLLDGHVPWITGWSFFPEFLIGATLPDGRALFAVVPLKNRRQIVVKMSQRKKVDNGTPEALPVSDGAEIAKGFPEPFPTRSRSSGSSTPPAPSPFSGEKGEGRVTISKPMEVASMGMGMTVTADFENYSIHESKVAFIKPAGWIQNSDMINIALQGHFAIGCAMAGIDVVRANSEKKPFLFLTDALNTLERELAALKMATAHAQQNSDDSTTPERLKVRAWAIDFCVRCAHAAIASSSGAANSINHPAQRIYREALVYTVSAQTPAVMEATLNRLIDRGGW